MVYTIVVHMYAKEDAESIQKLSAKLAEASQVYSQDKETLSWFVMQDTSDPRKFCIVERYLKESEYHLNNPYWKTFDPYVIPLLAAPMDLRRFEELDTSVTGAGAHYHEDAVKTETSLGDMYKGTDA
ncbi:antibiotic biosynthesis monooxygenase [Stemphylium lycopersici]|uniref:Antibiotic biosynthesis monooxygenase n=1 Tax=Stemphylium lycopersici TaxID=183478 RepID=A0A364N8L8_STELY|nr:antibiotic biosynthesis monooxygenase [Stemphylium lycopersici]RAR06331.1 antibiotic biosynthesis monooxygenase [Stemphylium lycopersici]RAR13674.1 antibiotic biosynthesis monooxygenase [Stemphylium lycopersici]